MIRLIGFDLDDTLWDVVPVIIRAEKFLDDWFKENVIELKFSVIEMRQFRDEVMIAQPELSGKITELRKQIIKRAMLFSGISNQRADLLANKAIDVFLKARNQIELFEGVEDVLATLSNNYTVCALSNGNADINRLGLNHLFHFAYSAEQVGGAKPSHHLFSAALNHTNLAAEEMIYVGDDPLLDVDAAKELGIHAIWMDRGRKPAGNQKADKTITNILQLTSAIKEIADSKSRN
ncbi:MAG: HAD superfamily hydrolase (TIGR01549 family) [Candidatus Azotimanducaceae bacterium]|jgi:HAD superfamily hydrolase (TIGR01549 family)